MPGKRAAAGDVESIELHAKRLLFATHADPAQLHALLLELSPALRAAVVAEAHRVHGNKFVDEALRTNRAPIAATFTPSQRIAAVAEHTEDVREHAADAIPKNATTKLADPGFSEAAAIANTHRLESALHAQVGGGDEKGFQKWAGENRYQMLQFVQALAGGSGASHPEPSDFYRLAMTAMKAQLPDSTFALVLAESRYGADGPQHTETLGPLIAATSKQGTTVWKIEPTAFGRGLDLVEIIEEAGLVEPWYAAFKKLTGKGFARLDASTAAKTLRRARDHSIGVEGGAVIAAVLEMAHADQVRFITAFDKATGIAPGRGQLAGGLLVQTAAPAKFVAAAPADHLATGAAAPKESAVTVSLDGVTETHRNWNFVDKNYKQVVGAQLGQHTLRGTEPRTLAGTDLENEVGVAMGEEASHLPETDQDLAKLEHRAWNCFQGNARVKAVANKLRDKGGDAPSVLVVPILFDSKNALDTGIVQFSVFRVGDSLVDHTARVYHSFEDWKHKNTLPAGRISYPKGLALHETAPGELDFTTEDTHAKHPSNLEKAEAVLDKAALVGGIILGGAAIVGTGGTALALAGGATAAYGAARSAEKLDDRADHEQSINPFTNSDARAEWLSFGANAVAVASLGTTAVAGRLAAAGEGGATASRAATAAGIVEKAAKVADTGAQINSANDLRRDWHALSPGQRANIALQLGFWGLQKSIVGTESRYGVDHAENTLAEAVEPQAAAREAVAGTAAEPTPEAQPKPGRLRNRLFGRMRETDASTGGRSAISDALAHLAEHDVLLAEIDALRVAHVASIASVVGMSEFHQFSPHDQAAIVRFLLRDTPGGRGANADHILLKFAEHPGAELAILRSAINSSFAATAWHPEFGELPERQHVQLGTVQQVSKRGGSHVRFELTVASGHVVEVTQLAPGAPPRGYRHPTAVEVQHVLAAQPPGVLAGLRKLYLTNTPHEGGVLSQDPAPTPRKPVTPSVRDPNRDLVPTARVTGGAVPSSRFNENVSGLFIPAPRGLDSATHAAEIADRGFDVGARYIKVRPIELDPADPQAALHDWQQTVTHELAHAFDFERGGRTQFAAEHDPAYAAAIRTDGREISGYGESAKHDPSEDFAEAYSLYILVQGTPREATMRALYPNRFGYLDRAIAAAR